MARNVAETRVFKTKAFNRWASRVGIGDAVLLDAASEMACGLIDADLGGNVFKKRIALPGRGKSGSARTIVATRFAGKLFFLYGFAKNDQSSIVGKELLAFKKVAAGLLSVADKELEVMLRDAKLLEVVYDQNYRRDA